MSGIVVQKLISENNCRKALVFEYTNILYISSLSKPENLKKQPYLVVSKLVVL